MLLFVTRCLKKRESSKGEGELCGFSCIRVLTAAAPGAVAAEADSTLVVELGHDVGVHLEHDLAPQVHGRC